MSSDYLKLAQEISKTRSPNRIIRFVRNADLRCAHEGLSKIAQDLDIDCPNLNAGDFVVFCNTNQTMLKIFAPGNVVASVKSPDGRRLDLRVVQYIPRFFNGTAFHYDEAIKKVIQK